jgi:transposase-like protein
MTVQFDPATLDSLLNQCNSKEDILGEGGLIKTYVKAIMERALDAEMTEHLGYSKHDPKGKNTGNSPGMDVVKKP